VRPRASTSSSPAALLVSAPALPRARLAIRLESHGHPIYRQRRVGRDGEAFDVLKLRTMVTGAEHMGAGMAIDEGDTRITRVGAFLRRTSIDELPNLINVLRGEMSSSARGRRSRCRSTQYTDRQRGALAVQPGLTGWAQVNGRAVAALAERIELDLWYIEHRSWRLDFQSSCGPRAWSLSGHGLYKGDTGGWKDPVS
jgi:lipopolysaccharide/colanic/teichoic acid biosynthesis glycosyltransferase